MRIAPLLTLSALCAPALTQTSAPLTARSFLFDDYRTVLSLDLETLRDTGVWDELAPSGIQGITSLFEQGMGFELDLLDRLVMTRGRHGEEEAVDYVMVFEGNAPLGKPGDLQRGFYQLEAVGGRELYKSEWGEEAFTTPAPKLHVYGSERALRSVLEGAPRRGLPSPDVMAFTAGKEHVILSAVADLVMEPEPLEMLREVMAEQLDGMAWPEGDAPSSMAARVSVIGDEDDPHIQLEVMLRHGTAGEGLALSERAGNAALDKLKKMPQARMFKPMLKRFEFERSGTDAMWRVDLGRARDCGGLLVGLSPLMVLGTTVRVVQQGQAVQVLEAEEVVEEVEEPPPPPPVRPGGGGGR